MGYAKFFYCFWDVKRNKMHTLNGNYLIFKKYKEYKQYFSKQKKVKR